MPIRELPPVPTRDDPANFALKGDAFLAALPAFREDANALEQSLQLVATTGTSTTSLTVGTGSKSLTTEPGKAWATGAWVYVFASAAVSNYMVGRVTSYNATTGALVVNVSAIDGSGTHSAWVIGLATPQIDTHLVPRDGSRAMTSALTLPGNAVNALEAVPKQQLDASPGRLLAVRVFTSANNGQTYTPTAGTTSVIVEAVGGGGGGGSSFNTGAAQASAGGGGGGGAYGVGRYASGFSGALLTIGGGGVGSSANASSAASGATTSFGVLLSVSGGQGGSSMGASSPTVFAVSGVPGSIASGANIKTAASPQSAPGWVAANGWISGPGGASPMGAGGTSVGNTSSGVSAAVGYGGGGSGGASGASSSGQPGGNGAPGVIIVWEYA